jgi:hypothetical protein
VAVAIFVLGRDGCAFGLTTRGSLAIAIWWTSGLVALLSLDPRLCSAGLLTVLMLAAFTAWTGASIAWADSAEMSPRPVAADR